MSDGIDWEIQSDGMEEPSSWWDLRQWSWGNLCRLLTGLILLTALILALVYVSDVKEWFQNFLNWMEDHPSLGATYFILLYILATVAFLPGSILTIGAGFIFSSVYGLVYVFIGSSTGATLAFVLSKFIFRDAVENLMENSSETVKKYFVAIDGAVFENGLTLIFLLRLSPLIPFNALNYFMGLTRISLLDYVVGCFGMIPGTIAYVYVGTTLSSLSEPAKSTPTTIALMIVGSILALVGVFYISYIAKKKLDEMLVLNEPLVEDEDLDTDSLLAQAN